MRLKNKNSIAFSIAKTKHAETPLVIGEKEKDKKNATELLITVQSHDSIAKYFITLTCGDSLEPTLRKAPDGIAPYIC